MARMSLNPPRTLLYRLFAWMSRRRFDTVLDPLKVLGHDSRVLLTYGMFEFGVGRWRALDLRLKQLAVLAVAARIGCRWCLDFGYWELHGHGIPVAKIEAIAHWQDSDVYTERERLVLAYAEALTETPPRVDDELVAALRAALGDAALVELSAMIGVENLRSRINAAAGLTGQGFKDRCAVPAPRPTR
jgi:AhpD family alkylhydroperoxidase